MSKIRTIKLNGHTWFYLGDVCRALNIDKHTVVSKLSDEHVQHISPTAQRLEREWKQSVRVIRGDAALLCIMQSRSAQAKAVAHAVLKGLASTDFHADLLEAAMSRHGGNAREPKAKWDVERVKLMLDMLDQGCSQQTVATRFGCCRTVIAHYCRRKDIPARLLAELPEEYLKRLR